MCWAAGREVPRWQRWPVPGPGVHSWTTQRPVNLCVPISLRPSGLPACCCLDQWFCQIHHSSKCSKSRHSHFVWLLLAVSQQHRYLYTRGCQLSNTGFFFELTNLATHMPRDPLVMCFSTSFSLVPNLFVCNVLFLPSARLPWWHLPLHPPVQWAAHPGFLSNHLTQCCLKRWHWYHQR